MKKIISMIMVLTISAISVNAQDVGPSTPTDLRNKSLYGFKIGANYSTAINSSGASFVADPKFGLVVGFSIIIPFTKYIGLQPEMLFSQKGFKATGVSLGETYSMTRTTNFIDMPILLAIKPSEMLTIVVGPQYSYLLTQKDDFSKGTASQQLELSKEIASNSIISAVTGVNITLKNTVIGLRAAWDLQKNNGGTTTTAPRYNNMWYQATVGLRF